MTPVGLKNLDRPVAIDRHGDAHGCDHQHQHEGGRTVPRHEELCAGLGRDHAVDGEPADGEEECQSRAGIGPTDPEDPRVKMIWV